MSSDIKAVLVEGFVWPIGSSRRWSVSLRRLDFAG
jgi:hypothetical protein